MIKLQFRDLSFVLAFLLIVISAKGQCLLDISTNTIREGDVVEKIYCHYGNINNGGQNVVWDFSDRIGKFPYTICYSTDSLSVLTENDGSTLYSYILHGDSLLQIGYETPLEYITYQEPLLGMIYPVQYGDSFSKHFQGKGKYCGTHEEQVSGEVSIIADAYGRLVLSGTDTLNQVLRVYTLKTQSISMNTDSCSGNPDNMKQEIEERFQWYARGYRYPVYESVSRTSYDNMQPVACHQYAYCCLPDNQQLLDDPDNEKLACQDAYEMAAAHNIFHYEISNCGNVINIIYNLDESAHIRYLVADVMGVVHRQAEEYNDAGSGYSMKIDCSGLARHHYILYISVNGKVYNEKIAIN